MNWRFTLFDYFLLIKLTWIQILLYGCKTHLYMNLCMHTYTHTHTRTLTDTCTLTHTRIRTCTRTLEYTETNVYTWIKNTPWSLDYNPDLKHRLYNALEELLTSSGQKCKLIIMMIIDKYAYILFCISRINWKKDHS